MEPNSFGVYLKALRKAKGVSSSHKLSFLSGVSQTFIVHLELGKRIPSPEIIRKLSTALGVSHIGMMIKAGHLTLEEVLAVRTKHGIED
ncbi:helix-turn-helix domain-containing protein [Paenibacillus agricola]|uniref:Helix-turn-helix transcriptional regulator n=1 Tax=Paenibacillus agricola TaxID=2716264 RepID=A0ABX0JF37_9BACL|nr:helix-turn-helix transcriptional regulator [Paenibacillus agricola]NHN33507.1 helix-turn-helix transcriptional regulator [Paenibacillus agricola]